ncbi:MAG: lytic transglycosylase domain-containing protein [Proteobacteria bacterium]|nr:lytic transglycosylase domain-containing protein [Pseudomonadota bacterium]
MPQLIPQKLKSLKDLWNHLPQTARRVVTVHLALLPLFAVIALSVANVTSHQGFERIRFATPALQTLDPWHHKVEAYGQRLNGAFGIGREVAVEFADWILEASARQNLEPDLISSLIFTESTFRKYVRSYAGAVGPAQVRPDMWGKFCGHNDLTDPKQNVLCGSQILAHLRDVCGDDECALQAYNIGLNGDRIGAAQRYVSKVDTHLAILASFPL